RRCHLMISLGRCDIEMLLQATDDVAQRALTRFRRGCARVATSHLPGGADAIVVVCNDRDVHGAAALRCRAQLGQDQGLELRFRLRQLLGFCLRRLVGHGPLLKRDAAAFERGRILLRLPHASATHSVRDSTSAERAAQERVRGKLRTWAAAPDGALAPAFWASESSLRAGPVSWQPCARVGWLPPSRGSCARTVFHTPCGASSRERRPRVASSF